MSISPLPNVIVILEQTASTEDDALGQACCGPENDPKPESMTSTDIAPGYRRAMAEKALYN
jgi:hypothetical protein